MAGISKERANQMAKNNMTLDEVKELKTLARKIRDHHEASDKFVQLSRKTGSEAIAEAIFAGQALTRVKKLVGHGRFIPWLKKNCKDITERTARRYMELSKRTHVTDLKSAKSLRQAYVAVGIINDDDVMNVPAQQSTAGVPTTTMTPITTTKTRNGKVVSMRPVSSVKQAYINRVEVVTGLVGDLVDQLRALTKKQVKAARAALSPLKRWVK
jgi:hypothetical protein